MYLNNQKINSLENIVKHDLNPSKHFPIKDV